MLSGKINSITQFLETAATAELPPSKAALEALLRVARSARDEAINLELATRVPLRQRVDQADLASGRVTVFPVIARREAVLA